MPDCENEGELKRKDNYTEQNFLNSSDLLNRTFYVNFNLQCKMKVVHLDEFLFRMLRSTEQRTSQVILVENGNFSVLFLHLLVVFENSLKQSGWIYDQNYTISEIEVYFCYLDQLLVQTLFQDLDQTVQKIMIEI